MECCGGRTHCLNGCNHDVHLHGGLAALPLCLGHQTVSMLFNQRLSSEHWRNGTESSCVYYAVLSFSQRTSKGEQVLLSSGRVCFTL